MGLPRGSLFTFSLLFFFFHSAHGQPLAPNVYRACEDKWCLGLRVDTNGVMTAWVGASVLEGSYETQDATNTPNGAIIIRFSRHVRFHGSLRKGRTEITGRLLVVSSNGSPHVYSVRLIPRYLPIKTGTYSGRGGGTLGAYLVEFIYSPFDSSTPSYRGCGWIDHEDQLWSGGHVVYPSQVVVHTNGSIRLTYRNIRVERWLTQQIMFHGKLTDDGNTIAGRLVVSSKDFRARINSVETARINLYRHEY
jgi:hypothetical protein